MTGSEHRRPRDRRWFVVMIVGVVGFVPGLFAFTMLARQGTGSVMDWITSSTLFFGSAGLALVGLLGHARVRRREQADRESAGPGPSGE